MDLIPPHSPRETNYRQRARSSTRTLPAKSLTLFFVDDFRVDDRFVLSPATAACFGTGFGSGLRASARSATAPGLSLFRGCLVEVRGNGLPGFIEFFAR